MVMVSLTADGVLVFGRWGFGILIDGLCRAGQAVMKRLKERDPEFHVSSHLLFQVLSLGHASNASSGISYKILLHWLISKRASPHTHHQSSCGI